MRLGLLGTLLVVDDADTGVVVPKGRLRVLLAALLTRPNQPVPLGELAEIVWDGAPTANAERSVRVYLGRLRRALGPTVGARIQTRAPGYQCEIDEDELDLLRFKLLCEKARSAAVDQLWSRAADLLDEALALWRGAPLVDIPSDLLRARELPGLERMRLQAVEDHIDAQLRLGRVEHLIPQLTDLTAQYPLREHVHAQLIRALANTGRRAEALDAYQRARGILVGQLGIEPGPELRRLQECILDGGEASLAPRPAGPVRPTGPAVPPRQLPASNRHFVGRSNEIKALTAVLTEQMYNGCGAAVISTIDGAPGVGKTALALHWAHQMAKEFPDGQLYVDLHGYDADDPGDYWGEPAEPVEPADALAGLLRALGMDDRQIPADPEERAAQYRSLLAGRRMLVVLDNVREAGKARLLLPGSGDCMALVISRESPAELVVRDGAQPLELDALAPAEAVALLRTLIGDRVETDQDAASHLADLCLCVPLALCRAAEVANSRPDRPLADLLEDLTLDFRCSR